MKRKIIQLIFIRIFLTQFHLIAQVIEFEHYFRELPLNYDRNKIMHDKIKTISIWHFPIQYGKVSSHGDKEYESQFDSLGKIISEHVYYESGGTRVFYYKRDNYGNVVKETQQEYLNSRQVNSHVNYEYSYKYDLNGNVTEMKVYEGAQGVFNYKVEYTYDSNDSLKEETEYTSNGNIFNHPIIYEYDSLNKIISKRMIDKYSFKYDYNSKGNIISCIYDYGGPETTCVYEYYDNNKIKSETASSDQTITITNYSLNGKIISGTKTVNNDDETKSTTSYIYDSRGNLSEIKLNMLTDEIKEYTKIIYSYY